MKNEKYRTYIYWGVTALVVLLLLVAAIFVVIRWSLVAGLAKKIAKILAPVIYGAVFAYLLTPVYNWVQNAVMKWTKKVISSEKSRKSLGAFLGTAASLVLLVAVVVGLISMLIPELINSTAGFWKPCHPALPIWKSGWKKYWQTTRIWNNRSWSITERLQIIFKTG